MEKLNLIDSLYDSWKRSPYPSVKLTSYFPAYAQIFGHLVNKECTFIETGVLGGGSLFMWRNWLGPKARIIGVELNPDAKKWEKEGFEIYIGDQGDPEFWADTFSKVGDFDGFLDDGGHQSFQQIVTATQAIKHARNNCVIAIEDTATSFMNDFRSHGRKSFLNYSKDATDILIGRSFDLYEKRFPNIKNNEILKEYQNVYNIQFFNGIVSFHVSKEFSEKPQIVRNMEQGPIIDYRYSGKNYALINWPDLFKNKLTKVNGGEILRYKVRNMIAKILPIRIKKLISKFISS